MLRRPLFIIYNLAFIILLPSAARADWSLTSADSSKQSQLTVNTWDHDALSVTGPGGNLVKIPTRDVVTLTSDHPITQSTKPWRLTLRNGDILPGEPLDISGQSLEYKADIGPLTIPLKMIQSLSISKTPPSTRAAPSTDKDLIQLTNGDQMEGIIAAILPDKIQIATGAEAATTDIALSLVQQISFGGASPQRALPPLSARLAFASGGTLTVPLAANAFSWTIDDISFTDPAGQSRKIASPLLASVEILGGRIISLTELDPAQDTQTSFLGGSWPTQIDRNVLGQDLRVANTTYSRGLGVHTRSLLAYDLDGSFDTLKLRVAMDDSASPHGEANVTILLDGKLLWKKHLTANTPETPEELSLPLHGGKHLELHADPVPNSGKLDVLGRVDYLNIALIRK